jgi:hypothetical protein
MIEAPDDNDFTDEFCAFLQASVANVDAAELLLLLDGQRTRAWSAAELATKVNPNGTVTDAEVAKYLDVFEQCHLVDRDAAGRVCYRPSDRVDEHLATLRRLYVERPVTLFRVIYALRDGKIKTLADAFRIWRK